MRRLTRAACMECLDETTVLRLVEGSLAGPEMERIDRHLDSCRTCRTLVAEVLREGGSSTVSDERLQVPLPAATAAPRGYRMGAEVARGGMGRVLAADDERFGRRVAIKHLAAASPELRRRFEREVQITARLQHPGIPPVYDAG